MKKPKIRFKGFNDDWEQRKFSDLVQIERGGSPRPIDDYITDSPQGLNWVKIGDAPTQGNYITKTAEKIRPEGLSKTREVHPGDLILSNSMSFGKPYIMGIDGCIHDGWLLIRNTYNIFDLTFLCHLLATPQMLKQYKSFASGSTVNNLNKEVVGNTNVTIPDIDEQRVLGQYFEQLDNLITLHQRKCNEIKKIKKYMLQNMFPQNDEKVPKIRFDGFTDDWEQRKLGEICETFEYGLNVAAKEYDGEHKYLRITDIDDSSHAFLQDNLTSPNVDFANSENYKLKYGDVLFARTGASVGKTYIYEDFDGLVYYAGFLIRGRVKSDYSPKFIFQNTLTDEYDRFIRITSQRSGQPGINALEYSRYQILVPTLAEQARIGEYFSNLDRLITLHQRKCDELKNIKKFMLQNMFV